MTWAKPTIRYCEPNLSGWINQPANAVSSLFISLAGVYILARNRHAYSRPLGIIAIILGLASFAYYATDTFAGQLTDLGSMFLLASLMLAVALKAKKVLPILIVGAGVPLVITAAFRTIWSFNVGIPLFAVLLGLSLYFELHSNRKNRGFYILTFVAFAAGFLFWWLDYKKVWCVPSSAHYFNGHAVWHFFNAVALIFLDRHYSQKPAGDT